MCLSLYNRGDLNRLAVRETGARVHLLDGKWPHLIISSPQFGSARLAVNEGAQLLENAAGERAGRVAEFLIGEEDTCAGQEQRHGDEQYHADGDRAHDCHGYQQWGAAERADCEHGVPLERLLGRGAHACCPPTQDERARLAEQQARDLARARGDVDDREARAGTNDDGQAAQEAEAHDGEAGQKKGGQHHTAEDRGHHERGRLRHHGGSPRDSAAELKR
mmetsp:Transcript_43882/g.108577  ORF Transcript_43882/g.108577 Transcript_43882/m.108577 type:complete len:220 (-) Transcript_43882:94-753(-)